MTINVWEYDTQYDMKEKLGMPNKVCLIRLNQMLRDITQVYCIRYKRKSIERKDVNEKIQVQMNLNFNNDNKYKDDVQQKGCFTKR